MTKKKVDSPVDGEITGVEPVVGEKAIAESPEKSNVKKVKLGILVNSDEALALLASQSIKPLSLSYTLGLLINEIGEFLRPYNEIRLNKYKEYGTQIIDNGVPTDKWIIEDMESRVIVQAELDELLNKEVTLKNFPTEPLSIDSFGDIEMQPIYMARLTWLFDSK